MTNMEITLPINTKIDELVENIQGWCPNDQLFAMYLLAINTKDLDGDLLEIGSWCGRSSVVLALAAEKIGTKLHCVDLFPNKEDWYKNEDGTYSFKVTKDNKEYFGCVFQTVWKEPFERDIVPMYDKYDKGTELILKDNLEKRGFLSLVKSYKGNSSEFADEFRGKIKFAFIDGDHGYEATYRDIKEVEKNLVSKGWIVFDDAYTVYTGVNKAIDELIICSGKYDLYQQLTRKCFAARKR